jgi:hypothetical protein
MAAIVQVHPKYQVESLGVFQRPKHTNNNKSYEKKIKIKKINCLLSTQEIWGSTIMRDKKFLLATQASFG